MVMLRKSEIKAITKQINDYFELVEVEDLQDLPGHHLSYLIGKMNTCKSWIDDLVSTLECHIEGYKHDY